MGKKKGVTEEGPTETDVLHLESDHISRTIRYKFKTHTKLPLPRPDNNTLFFKHFRVLLLTPLIDPSSIEALI
ncbi:MAG: hypothetical protein CME71_01455 [Halobacteriovorax sp.]|nr:hypothetical protein [Halobacteriovorax sp.]